MPASAPGAATAPRPPQDRTSAHALALVLGAVFLVHGRSVAFGFIGLDDQDLVADDAAFLRGPVSLLRIFTRSYMHVVDPHHPYYRPLITASFALDAHWPTISPVAYHATNLLVHAGASLLVLGLLRRFGMGAAATAGALLFAVHPALAAAVAWIPGRNDSLLTVFVLAAWLFLPFAGFARSNAPRPSGRLRGLAPHLAFFAAALLTKETALVAPVVWTTHLALQPRTAPREREERASTFAWSWIGLAAGWPPLVAARFALAATPAPSVGFREAPRLASLLVRNLGAVVLPLNPALLSDAQDLPLAAGIAALVLAAATAWIPGVRRRVLAVGAAAYVVFSLPGFFAGTSLVLATRLYLPTCGVVLVATEGLRALIARLHRPEAQRTAAGFAFVIAAVFALVSLVYEGSFANRRRFAYAEVDASPHCAMAHFCLGASEQMDGEPVTAMAEYRSALALGAVEVVHNNMAVLEMAHDQWALAEADLRQEIAVNPDYGLAYLNLAVVLRHEGRGADAAQADARAASLQDSPPR